MSFTDDGLSLSPSIYMNWHMSDMAERTTSEIDFFSLVLISRIVIVMILCNKHIDTSIIFTAILVSSYVHSIAALIISRPHSTIGMCIKSNTKANIVSSAEQYK